MPRNLCSNPSAAGGVGGWAAIQGSGVANTPQPVSGLGGAWSRSTAARVTAPGTPGAYTQLVSPQYIGTGDLTGKTFSATCQWSCSAAPPSGLYVFLAWYDVNNTYLGSDALTTYPVTAGTVTTTVRVGAALTGTRRVAICVWGNGTVASGWNATMTAVRIDEVNDPALAYADGDTVGWSWDGTAGSSTSTQNTAPAGSLWPWLCDALNEPPTPAEAVDDFAGQPDGALTTADTGQSWSVVSAGTNPITSTVRGGAIRPPAGWTVPATDTAAGVSSGYAYLPFPAPVTWVGADVAWDPTATSSNQGGGCLASCNTLGYQGTPTSCPIHLSFGWNFVEMAVFQNGIANFTTLVPSGGSTSMVTLANPMPRDGATTTRLDVVVDRTVGRCWVTVGTNPLLVYNDSRLTLASTWAFWQHYLPAGSINVPRYTKVWASSRH